MRFLLFALPFLGLLIAPRFAPSPSSNLTPTQAPTISPTPSLFPPTVEFKQRITKKRFGTYVSPENSPVSPERFTGYHTAVDVEFGDTNDDIPVHAITSGTVVYSGWVSGYGGLIIIRHIIDNNQYNVVYGHLRSANLLPVNTSVTANQIIGYLGNAYSRDTDNERKHLHFGIPKGDEIQFLGYVPTRSQLSGWIDPLSIID